MTQFRPKANGTSGKTLQMMSTEALHVCLTDPFPEWPKILVSKLGIDRYGFISSALANDRYAADTRKNNNIISARYIGRADISVYPY